MGNFYKEPSYAKKLERLVGTHTIPKQLNKEYVNTVVECFLTNGNGVCWDAEPIYLGFINNFNEDQLIASILVYSDTKISSKLQFHLGITKFRELLTIVKPRVTTPAAIELIDKIEKFNGPLHKMKNDATLQKFSEILYKSIT